VVIVDKYSYSAAEFFAAALQEYGKAEIVGEATTGKGYAQPIELTDEPPCFRDRVFYAEEKALPE
jgi:C-terminal processing protease CtpA/Prc